MKSFPKYAFAWCLSGALLAALTADVQVASAWSETSPSEASWLTMDRAFPPSDEASSSGQAEAPSTTVGHLDQISLEIVPAEIAEFNEFRVHTGKTRVREDGEVEAVYVMEYPKDGNVFLEIVLHVSAEGAPLVVTRSDILLIETGDSAAPSIRAHSIATESGRIPEEETVVSISGQKILRIMFDIDPKVMESKLLVLGNVSVGTVADIRRLIAKAEDPAGTTP